MAKKVFNMQGGRHSAAALSAFINAMYGSSVANGLNVQVTGSAGLNVLVKVGNGNINTGTGFGRLIQIDADETVALTAASASNPRNDIIVAYIDNSVTPTTAVTDNTNNILKFAAVAGTPASSPTDPSGSAIQAAVGAGNPYMILGRVRVNTSATSLTAPNITDLRKLVVPLASDSVGAVNSQMILDGTIQNSDLANSSVKSNNIDYSSVTTFQSYAQKTTDITNFTAPSDTQMPGLSSVSVVADGVRRIKVTFRGVEAWRGAGGIIAMKIWEGAVGSGTPRAVMQVNPTTGVNTVSPHIVYVSNGVPTAGTYTFNVSVMAASGSGFNLNCSLSPAYLLAELF